MVITMIENTEKLSAFIAIVGRPNVGKSSVLNKLLGQKVAIVSRKPQTTRTRIMGVLTQEDHQMVFIDTPGLIKAKNSLGEYMVRSVFESVSGVDACMLVVEADTDISKADIELTKRFSQQNIPAILVINKIDLVKDKTKLMEQIDALNKHFEFKSIVPVSAKDGDGINILKTELQSLCMPGGHFFSDDTLTDQPERVIASEIVREKILRLLDKEIPHGVAVVTESMKERPGITDIDATIYCERSTHKGIIIGKGGEMLKKIGTFAREDMEKFFDCKINLKLWVKVKEDWRQRPNILHNLGFNKNDFSL